MSLQVERPLHKHPNYLICSLYSDIIAPVLEHSAVVTLEPGIVLYESGAQVEHVYFPHGGMISLLVVMQNGKAIETATVGREGVVGAMAGLGLYTSIVRAEVQLPMAATKIAAARFRQAVAASPEIEHLCIAFNEVLLSQARVTAACNALHPVDARFCRWLLQSADRAESSTVGLTQKLLSEMRGVRRTSVADVSGKLQRDGVIAVTRGLIHILDRAALEGLACECYRSLIHQSVAVQAP